MATSKREALSRGLCKIRSLEFELEWAWLHITEALLAEMEAQGVNRTELARRVGKSKPWVTKVLSLESNPTLKSLVILARALGLRWEVHLASPGKPSR